MSQEERAQLKRIRRKKSEKRRKSLLRMRMNMTTDMTPHEDAHNPLFSLPVAKKQAQVCGQGGSAAQAVC